MAESIGFLATPGFPRALPGRFLRALDPLPYAGVGVAAVTGHRQPLGGIVVRGGVTTAVLNAVVAEELPGPGSVFLQLDLRFRAPVRPGDVIGYTEPLAPSSSSTSA